MFRCIWWTHISYERAFSVDLKILLEPKCLFSGRREDLECTGQLFNCDFSRIILFQKLVHLKPYISTLLLVQICGG